jgi:hypothetical protein
MVTLLGDYLWKIISFPSPALSRCTLNPSVTFKSNANSMTILKKTDMHVVMNAKKEEDFMLPHQYLLATAKILVKQSKVEYPMKRK